MRYLPLVLILCSVTLFGCKKTYTIVCESSNEAWGTVTGGGEYRDGETAVLTATPTEGYYFLSWQDGDVSNPRTITVNGDATYTAKFADTPFGEFDGEPLHVSGKICSDQVWPDMGLYIDYIIEGTLYIGCNATIRVMPGVTIMFTDSEGNIEVVENGALNMSGTENNPIVLRGPDDQPYPGQWGRVVVNTTRLDNTFSWVEFRNGGSSEDLYGGVVNVRGSLSMMCCTIDGSNGSGLVTEGESVLPVFAYNIIQNCSGYPWVTSSFPALYKGEITDNVLDYQNMIKKYVYIDLDHYEIDEPVTLNGLNLAWYYFTHGFYFDGNGTLTLNEAQIFVGKGKQLRVGKNLSFKAYGGDNYIAPLSPSQAWDGMVFESERSDNIISNYRFYATGIALDTTMYCCLKITENAKLQLHNCRFGPARRYGVWIENIETWGNVTHSGNEAYDPIPYLAHIQHGGTFNGHTYADNTDLDQLP